MLRNDIASEASNWIYEGEQRNESGEILFRGQTFVQYVRERMRVRDAETFSNISSEYIPPVTGGGKGQQQQQYYPNTYAHEWYPDPWAGWQKETKARGGKPHEQRKQANAVQHEIDKTQTRKKSQAKLDREARHLQSLAEKKATKKANAAAAAAALKDGSASEDAPKPPPQNKKGKGGQKGNPR